MLKAAMAPQRYRLVVEAELGARDALAFGEMTLSAQNGETVITGTIIDSSRLHGVLDRIPSLGLTLRSVNPLEAENARAQAQPRRTNRERRVRPTDPPRDSRSPGGPDPAKPKGKHDG